MVNLGGLKVENQAVELAKELSQQFAQGRHFQPTAMQQQHQQFASEDRGQLASVNGGRPQTFATRDNAAYHQLAQQHIQSQPISAQDRQNGRNFNTNRFQGRQANQDQRIANGLRSGQMTSGEAAQANRTQAGINQQVRTDRQMNGGGPLNQQQRQQKTGTASHKWIPSSPARVSPEP